MKQKMSQAELEALLMEQLRKHPECDHVLAVTITRPVQQSPGDPNWDAAWSVDGNRIACPRAFEIARQLRGQFDTDSVGPVPRATG